MYKSFIHEFFCLYIKNVYCYFSANFGVYPIDPTYSSRSFFFLRILCFGYHGKMSFLSISHGLSLIYMKNTDLNTFSEAILQNELERSFKNSFSGAL